MKEVIASSTSVQAADHDLAETLRWFDLTEDDRIRTRELSQISDDVAEEIISAFYAHLLSDETAAGHFRGEDHIARVKQGQMRYFRELITAEHDAQYVKDRRRIGSIHERTGVTPTLYIGSYAYYLNKLAKSVLHRMEDSERAFQLMLSLFKIAHFDMSLALETYVDAREDTIQARERELSELPTPVLQLKPGLLLIPVVGMLDSFRARTLTEQLLEGIKEHRARAVVLDITGVSAVDSAVANHLIQSMAAARLMGAKSVLTASPPKWRNPLSKWGSLASP